MRFFILFIALSFLHLQADFKSKLGDLVNLEGVKKNLLTGYGLVVGLNGTGDSRSALTRKTINQYLAHLGIDIEERQLTTQNAAVVAVTAELVGFYEIGDLVDVHVASLGDAESVENGLLLQTVLKAPNGTNYAVASGVVGTLSGENGMPSRGQVISGGIIEKVVKDESAFNFDKGMVLNLIHPSISLANEIKKTIESQKPEYKVSINDYKKINIQSQQKKTLSFQDIADIMDIEVNVKPPAKVIIDRNTGIVVVANNVRVDSAFVSLPGISINVGERNEGQLINNMIRPNTTVEELAGQFNQIGLSPERIISIFSALKKSGAINAEIITQ